MPRTKFGIFSLSQVPDLAKVVESFDDDLSFFELEMGCLPGRNARVEPRREVAVARVNSQAFPQPGNWLARFTQAAS